MIHQPHFFPWPPYMARVILSEVFVVLDDVQFRKNYFQNRTILIDNKGNFMWLSLPVNGHLNFNINETRLAINYEGFINKIIKTIEQNYSKCGYFDKTWDPIKKYLLTIYSGKESNLSVISTDSIRLICSLLELSPPLILFSSELNTGEIERTKRILSIIKLSSKNMFLTGWGGGSNPIVHHTRLITDNGFIIKTMNKQIATNIDPSFIKYSGISTLHWIFVKGPDYVREKLISYNKAML